MTTMISLDEAIKNWEQDGIWKIAPAGLSWIAEGARASIGEWASIGANASDVVDLGWADGYRKCIAQVNGVAYIGAGCRWFPLADAIEHWERNHPAGTRDLTLCLMQEAIRIAVLRGWKLSEAA